MFETLRIGELALREHLVRAEDLERAVAEQRARGGRLGSLLAAQGSLSADQVSEILAEQHGVPAAAEQALREVSSAALGALPRELAARFTALPLRLEGTTLHAALHDPQDLGAVDRLGLALGCAIQPHAAAEVLLFRYLALHYNIPVPEHYRSRPAAPQPGARQPGAPAAVRPLREPSSELVFLDQVLHFPAVAAESLDVDVSDATEREAAADGADPLDALDVDIDIDVVTEEVQHGQLVAVSALLDQLAVAADAEAVIGLLLKPFVAEASLVVLLRPRGDAAVALGAAGAAMPVERVRQLQVPLQNAAHVRLAVETRAPVRRTVAEDPALQGIAGQLGAPAPREAYAAPICVGDKVVNVLCVQTQGALVATSLASIVRIAAAGGEAYARIIAQRKRSG